MHLINSLVYIPVILNPLKHIIVVMLYALMMKIFIFSETIPHNTIPSSKSFLKISDLPTFWKWRVHAMTSRDASKTSANIGYLGWRVLSVNLYQN